MYLYQYQNSNENEIDDFPAIDEKVKKIKEKSGGYHSQ